MLLWLKSPSLLLFILTCIQTFALAIPFRSGRSLLDLVGCVLLGFGVFNRFSSKGAGADTA